MNKFADFADTSACPIMDGKKVPLNDVLEKEIVVINYRINKTKYTDAKNPECLTVQFTFAKTDEHNVFFSGSSVLMGQLERYKDKLPFSTVIKRVGKYFTFS